MNAGVVGEFGVEGRGENVALSQTDHTPINLGLDRGVRPDIGDCLLYTSDAADEL